MEHIKDLETEKYAIQERGKYCFLKRRNMHRESQNCNDGAPVFFRASPKFIGQPEAIPFKLQPFEISNSIVTFVIALLSSPDKIRRHPQWWFQHIMVIIIVAMAIEEWQRWEGLPHYTEIVDPSNVFRVSVSATEFATMIYSALNALKCAPMYWNVEYWQVWFIPPWIPESPQASVSHSGILYTSTLSIYISL